MAQLEQDAAALDPADIASPWARINGRFGEGPRIRTLIAHPVR